MKVYIIEAQRNAKNSKPFVWNVYSSKDKALLVLKELKHDNEYMYFLSEYQVID